MANAIKRLLELEGLLKYHDHMYHTLDQPVIADSEYDILKLEYDELAVEHPEMLDPEVRPGFVDPPERLAKVDILEPMISIGKRKNKEEFNKWIKNNVKTEAVYEDKLDGVALRFIYLNGILDRIHTRGRRNIGGDVSHRRHLLKNVPDTVELHEDKARVEFTGEAFCKHADFKTYCERHGLDINDVDPRSIVSGLMKRHNSSERDDLPVYVKIYGASDNVRAEYATYLELRDHVTECGFDVPMLITGGLLAELLELTKLPEFDYPIDGIVVKDNDLRQWEKEQTGEYYTYAVCYKFPTIALDTKVTGIDWSLSAIGELIPTLTYEPVDYGGTKLTRCKLDYAASYFDKGLRIGSHIQVTKANEIIPRLVALVEPGTGARLNYPDKCPFCDQLTTREEKIAKCINPACDGQLAKRLSTVSSLDGLNIDGLGRKRITSLVDKGYISRPVDILGLKEDDLLGAGIPLGSVPDIMEEIKASQKRDLSAWLFALSIPSLGKVRAVELSALSASNGLNEGIKFHNLQDFMTILTNAQQLCSMFGMEGAQIAAHVIKYREEIEEFLQHYDFGRPAPIGLDGVPVAISGTWNGLTRRDLTEVLRQNDFVLSERVTRSCKALILGSKPSPSKLETAKRYGIPTYDITQIHEVNGIVSLLLNMNH